MAAGDLWWDILNEDPYTAYRAFSNKWGTGRQADYYKNAFVDIHSKYQSDMGNLMRQNQVPQEDFASWLNRFNFGHNWQGMAPGPAGRQPTSAANPFIKWNR